MFEVTSLLIIKYYNMYDVPNNNLIITNSVKNKKNKKINVIWFGILL